MKLRSLETAGCYGIENEVRLYDTYLGAPRAPYDMREEHSFSAQQNNLE